MKQFIIISILLLGGMISLTGQNNFYFKKWKANGEISTNKIVLVMEPTTSNEGIDLNERLAVLLTENLNHLGVRTSYNFSLTDIDKEALIIKFDMVRPANVQLGTFQSPVPCHRYEIEQVNKFPSKEKNRIKTTLSISIENEITGLEEAAKKLAGVIYESLKK